MLRRQRQIRIQLNQLKDTALFGLALWLAHFTRERLDWNVLGIPSYLHARYGWALFDTTRVIEPFSAFVWLYVVLIPGVPLILESQGFYDRPLIARRRDIGWKLLKSCILTTIGVILCTFFMKEAPARGVFVLFGAFSFLLVFASEEILRSFYKNRMAQTQLRQKYVLIGAGEDTARLREELKSRRDEGLQVISEVDLNQSSVESLMQLLHDHSATGIIIN